MNEDLEMVILADQLGFDEGWLGEHFTSIRENIPAPDLLIAQAMLAHRDIYVADTDVDALLASFGAGVGA